MGVGARNNAELVRVCAKHFLKSDAGDQALTHETAVHLSDHAARTEQAVIVVLEACKLVGRRQRRVGLRRALGLGHLDRHSIGSASLGPLPGDLRAVRGARREHQAIGYVRVVRD